MNHASLKGDGLSISSTPNFTNQSQAILGQTCELVCIKIGRPVKDPLEEGTFVKTIKHNIKQSPWLLHVSSVYCQQPPELGDLRH